MATPRRPVRATMGAQSVSNAAHSSIRRVEDAMLEILSSFSGMDSAEVIKNSLEPTFQKALTYTPVKTGKLRASGFLEIVTYRGNPRVDIGFGRGNNPSYAGIVHERIDVYHRPPTRAKFLQAAVNEDMAQIERRLAKGYAELLEKSGRTGAKSGKRLSSRDARGRFTRG